VGLSITTDQSGKPVRGEKNGRSVKSGKGASDEAVGY